MGVDWEGAQGTLRVLEMVWCGSNASYQVHLEKNQTVHLKQVHLKQVRVDFPGVQWLRLHTPNAGGPGFIPG